MAFGDIEYHDNYYTHQEGRVHVQDERGCYIVYDAALEDLRYVDDVPLHSTPYEYAHMIEIKSFTFSTPILRPILRHTSMYSFRAN